MSQYQRNINKFNEYLTQSLPYLQEETQRGMYDVILHVGDFAYDMHNQDAKVGDQFMRQLQPVAAYLPYMVCPGNHEEA